MRMPELRTERLVVREFVASDLDIVNRLQGSDQRRWLEWTILSYEQLAVLHQPPYGDRAIVRSDTGDVIGACGLVPLLGPFGDVIGGSTGVTAEVGLYWAVLAEHQRQGLATEAGRALVDYAINTLNVQRVLATTTYDNAASIRVMEKIGMRIARNPRNEPAWLQLVGVTERG
jgi:ribosomal-protein-alanine N-acetyltransferase